MGSPAAELASRFERALVAAFGDELSGTDPVIRPSQFADFQANVALALAKRLGAKPRDVAERIVAALDVADLAETPEISGPGFINVTLRRSWIAAALTDQAADPRLGVAAQQQRVVTIDYSAPNVAKEMHVGHLRTTVVGDSLVRTMERLGHRVVRQNHIGDWGTPFGMLLEHLLEVGEDSEEARLLVESPNDFYQAARAKFDAAEAARTGSSAAEAAAEDAEELLEEALGHAEVQYAADADFATRARARVVTLQSGDPETMRLWQQMITLSKSYFNTIYAKLGVTLTDADLAGESSYNDLLPGVCEELEAAGIATVSDGALCVFLDEFTGREGKPVPLIIRKSDGGYGYATTDLATIRHRVRELGSDEVLYVVGAPQSLHFQMVFAAARKAGWLPDSVRVEHVQIGNVLGEDGKILRTRSGAPLKLMALLEEAVERASAVLAEARPEWTEEQRIAIAAQVGIGAVKYADLSVAHDSEYTFDFDRMLSLTGNTGPYLQYAAARIRSILRKAADEGEQAGPITVAEEAERQLALRLLDFGDVVAQVGAAYEPHRLCGYLFDLAQSFTGFYEKCPVLRAEDPAVRASRLALCTVTLDVLVQGLSLLGIESPEQM